MIGVDWGTSGFRAYRFGFNGEIQAQVESARGITTVADGDFARVLLEECGEWLRDGETRVLMAGMIGSQQGWMEAPYIACPVNMDRLKAAIITVPFEGADVRIVPGLSDRDPFGVPEIMRGEETQLIGVRTDMAGTELVCLPGSHSKWVRVTRGQVAGFSTYLAGEAYAALRGSTILGRTMADGPADPQAFQNGIERSGHPGHLLHHLFGVRSLAVMGELSREAGASYLSGLLIGTEVRAAMAPGARVHLVGNANLCTLYRVAIAVCGGTAQVEDEGAAARGLSRIGALLWR
jgi:2-dehydro-3-deoxygalactonokinase